MPHTRGSSHGQTRGIRKAYYEYFYAEMMPDAYEQWQLLEKESNIELLRCIKIYTLMFICNFPYNTTCVNLNNNRN